MNILSYVLFFLAGMATLLIGIPQFAADGKLNRDRAPGFVYGLNRPTLIALNILAILPGIVVIGQRGVFSVPTLFVLLGIAFGALPVLGYLMSDS